MLVVSIPASDIEVGGQRGKDALVRLKNAIGRVQSPWRPATAEESFEIVRRRLFQPIPEERYPLRDAVVRSFIQLYNEQKKDFPGRVLRAGLRRPDEGGVPDPPRALPPAV